MKNCLASTPVANRRDVIGQGTYGMLDIHRSIITGAFMNVMFGGWNSSVGVAVLRDASLRV